MTLAACVWGRCRAAERAPSRSGGLGAPDIFVLSMPTAETSRSVMILAPERRGCRPARATCARGRGSRRRRAGRDDSGVQDTCHWPSTRRQADLRLVGPVGGGRRDVPAGEQRGRGVVGALVRGDSLSDTWGRRSAEVLVGRLDEGGRPGGVVPLKATPARSPRPARPRGRGRPRRARAPTGRGSSPLRARRRAPPQRDGDESPGARSPDHGSTVRARRRSAVTVGRCRRRRNGRTRGRLGVPGPSGGPPAGGRGRAVATGRATRACR